MNPAGFLLIGLICVEVACGSDATPPSQDSGAPPTTGDSGTGHDASPPAYDASANDGGAAGVHDTGAASDGDGGTILTMGDAGVAPDAAGGDSAVGPQQDAQVVLRACAEPQATGTVLFAGDHRSAVTLLSANDRVLSVDALGGQWAIWDTASGLPIGRGGDAEGGAISAGTFALARATSLDIRRASDGQSIGTAPRDGGGFGVASDGSYVWTASATGLRAYSPSGTLQQMWVGNYGSAAVSATHDELRVARGAAGDGTLERLSVATGASSTTTFLGTFAAWFADGERFITTAADRSSARVYSATGDQVGLLAFEMPAYTVGGYGNYVWTTAPFALYRVGGATRPVLEWDYINGPADVVVASSHFIASRAAGMGATVDLTADVPKFTPLAGYDDSFAATSAGTTFVANSFGVISRTAAAGGTPAPLNCGKALDIAVSASGRFAVAFAANQVVVGDTTSRTSFRAIPGRAGSVRLTADGTSLVTLAEEYPASDASDASVRVYNASTGVLAMEFASQRSFTDRFYWGVEVPSTASRLLRIKCQPPASGASWTCSGALSGLAGTTAELEQNSTAFDDSGFRMVLSASGGLAATAPESGFLMRVPTASTRIYKDGSLSGAAPGYALSWLNESLLVVQRYTLRNGFSVYSSSAIVDASGADSVPTLALPQLLGRVTALRSGTLLYASPENKVFRVDSAAAIWTKPTGVGAANDTSVVYATAGAEIAIETY